jgi:D-3-phosphoglycerate dehydrogenase
VPFYCLDEVSNHALALLLALHRRLFTADRLLREGRHDLQRLRPIPRLKDCVAGLVGFGRIARTLATKLQPLARMVMAADPLVSREAMAGAGVEKGELEELFAASDFISVHVPLTAATRGLVSAGLIARMKPTAFLLNTSRGQVVDEAALIAALQERRIAGAGLDVFATEPLPADNALRALDNVILTSHYAWYSEGAIRELKETAAQEVVRVLRGEAPLYAVS